MTAAQRGRNGISHPINVGTVVALCGFWMGCGGEEPGSRSDGAMAGGTVMVVPPASTGQAGSSSPGNGSRAGTGAGQAGMAAPGAAGNGVPPVAGSGSAGMAGSPMAGMGAAGMMGGAGAGTGGSGGSGEPAGDVCERWKTAHANLGEIMWTGSVDSCDAGDISDAARQSALGLVNLYRSLAGLDPVEMTEEGNRLAQVCAMVMTANGRISHTIDSSWECYSADAAEAASTSSLSGGDAVSSVGGYMIDPGNPTTIGHRRWILSNMLAGVGFGSTARFSCQYQPARRPPAGSKPWVAWPPPGQVPIQAFGSRFATIDQTGWTVQSDTIDLGSAQVTVTSGGTDMAVTVTPLASGYGSIHAIRFNPMGWTTQAGQTYSVSISGASMPIEYDVEVVDCP